MPLGTRDAVGAPARARGPKRTSPLFLLTLKLHGLTVLMFRVLCGGLGWRSRRFGDGIQPRKHAK